jgi:hypothetical protein
VQRLASAIVERHREQLVREVTALREADPALSSSSSLDQLSRELDLEALEGFWRKKAVERTVRDFTNALRQDFENDGPDLV